MGKRFYEVMVRRYGESGPLLIVLHGGPAHQDRLGGLADSFKVLAPFQRGSGAEPLSVALHVADLFRLIQELGAEEHPALVGHSWGAMLALAYAGARPGAVSRLVLIGWHV